MAVGLSEETKRRMDEILKSSGTAPKSEASLAPGAESSGAAAAVTRPKKFHRVAVTAGAKEEKQPIGRPPTSGARCLRCQKKLKYCRCKEGALLPARITEALKLAEAQKKPQLVLSDLFITSGLKTVFGLAAAGSCLYTKASLQKNQDIWLAEQNIRALGPPTKAVLEKYSPEWLLKYQAEIVLAFVAMPILTGCLLATHLLRKQTSDADRQGQIREIERAAQETKPVPAKPEAPASGMAM